MRPYGRDMTETSHLRILNRQHLESLDLGWDDLMDAIDDAFTQKSKGQVQNPAKPKVASRPDSFFNAMPAYLGGSDQVGLKWVSGVDSNKAEGLPYIYGSMILNDAATGRPIALLDGGWLTDIRTPAVSAAVLRALNRSVRRLAIIGAGVQTRGHLAAALHTCPSIEHVTIYDRTPDKAAAVLAGAGERETHVAEGPEAAVQDADLIITTVTRALEPRLDCDTADPNAILLPVDYDDALSPRAINDSALFVVDDIDQYTNVAARGDNFGELKDPDGESAQLITRSLSLPPDGRICVMNLGLALEDVAIASLCLQRAEERNIGTLVEFP